MMNTSSPETPSALRSRKGTYWISVYTVAGFVMVFLMFQQNWWASLLGILFPDSHPVMHPRDVLGILFLEHVFMILLSSCLTILLGVGLGIAFSRPILIPLKPLVEAMGALSQTIPPVAVLALSVPLFGYGLLPTVTALVLYGMLPVLSGTLGGMDAISPDVHESARGCGMTSLEILFRIDLPIAAPYMIAGIRTAIGTSVGTAMIGALIGAGGLGAPLTAGLSRDNPAFVFEGVLPALMLAFYIDTGLARIEHMVKGEG